MAVTSALLTVAEFEALPQPPGGVRQELHHGVVFELPPEKLGHTRAQKRLITLIENALPATAFSVDKEFPFRPLSEHEVWVADVAVYDVKTEQSMCGDDYYRGVPVAVLEVLSPSNTASEMLDRETICLRNGGIEFWLVDPKRERVKVVTADGSRALGVSIAVRDIFYS